MFNKNFYPTPPNVIEIMLSGEDLNGKIVLEPQGGSGKIVDYCKEHGAADVLACEIEKELRAILAGKCKIIGEDFLKITSDKISHVDYIISNPPFDADEKHILHAWSIAPSGCKIIALCNLATIENLCTKQRAELKRIIDDYGTYEDLGDCFSEAERKTGVEVALIRIQKPTNDYGQEFEGFFMEDEPEVQSDAGIMPYNVIRDLVNRYVAAVKLFDKQIELGVQMSELTSGFYSSELSFSCTEGDKPKTRLDFKKDLQKSGWKFIFEKLNMQKYTTRGLMQDINKFVEKQTAVPFTMKNIYAMLEMVVGTHGSRMDQALLEVFDKVTAHYDENRYNVEGWKTNSHYLINQKFILPRMCAQDKWHTGNSINLNFGSYFDLIEDMVKALCYITGDNFDNFRSLYNTIRNEHIVRYGNETELFSTTDGYSGSTERMKELQKKGIKAEYSHEPKIYGEWFKWTYFEVKAFKKGTMHFKFESEDLWGKLNQNVARIKNYPLYEHVKKTQKEKQDC